MKKNIITLFALVCIIAGMSSCTKIKELFTPKYKVDAMIEDYAKFKAEGEEWKAQKLYDKLMQMDEAGELTDDQYYRFEDAQNQ